MLVSLRKKVRSLIDSFPPTDLMISSAYPGLATLGDQITTSATYSRFEKSSRDLAGPVNSTLGPNAANPSVYHDVHPHSSTDARPAIDAMINILPITKQPAVKFIAAGKHVLSEKPAAKALRPGSALRKNMFQSIDRGTFFGGWQKTLSTSPPSATVGSVELSVSLRQYLSSLPRTKSTKHYKANWRAVPDVSWSCLPSLSTGLQSLTLCLVVSEWFPCKFQLAFCSRIPT